MMNSQEIVSASPSYRAGWGAGLAMGALSMSVLSYINMLGMEKSIFAIVLAVMVLRGANTPLAHSRARWALGIAIFHVGLILASLVLFRDSLLRLLHLLATLR